MADANKPWVVRDVPDMTRRRVKLYAVQQGITIAEALTRIVNMALGFEVDPAELSPSPQPNMEPLTSAEADAVRRWLETLGKNDHGE